MIHEVEIKFLVTHLLDVEAPHNATDKDIEALAMAQWGSGDEGTIIDGETYDLRIRHPRENAS